MTVRLPVRLLLPLFAVALGLAACGDGAEPTGDAPAATGAETTTPGPSAPASTAPATVVTTTLGAATIAACAELEAISTEISGQFEGSVGIEADAVLDEAQTAAVRDLSERYVAVDVPDEGVDALRDDVVTAANAVLTRAAASEPLTEAEATGLTGALAQLGSLCSVSR